MSRDRSHGDQRGSVPARPAELEPTARDVMRTLPSVSKRDSLARAAELMESLGTREVAVTEGRTLVGILTRTDLEPHRGHFEWTSVAVAMTPDPLSVAPGAPLGAVMRLLLERKFNSVPVTAAGDLLGMICRSDVLRALAEV